MTQGLKERSPSEIAQEIARLEPSVKNMIARAADTGRVGVHHERDALVCIAPVSFPGGVGKGRLCVEVFRYRGRVRIDVRLVHNRVFARQDGSPSGRRLYLNDFVASVAIDTSATEVPDSFVEKVVRGVDQAQTAVRRHNADLAAYWLEILVAEAA